MRAEVDDDRAEQAGVAALSKISTTKTPALLKSLQSDDGHSEVFKFPAISTTAPKYQAPPVPKAGSQKLGVRSITYHLSITTFLN
jgi:hypothetical protein